MKEVNVYTEYFDDKDYLKKDFNKFLVGEEVIDERNNLVIKRQKWGNFFLNFTDIDKMPDEWKERFKKIKPLILNPIHPFYKLNPHQDNYLKFISMLDNYIEEESPEEVSEVIKLGMEFRKKILNISNEWDMFIEYMEESLDRIK